MKLDQHLRPGIHTATQPEGHALEFRSTGGAAVATNATDVASSTPLELPLPSAMEPAPTLGVFKLRGCSGLEFALVIYITLNKLAACRGGAKTEQ